MKALQVVSRGVAEFISTSIPEIKSGFALVKPKYITLCGSDIWMLHHCPDEMYPFEPGTTGHEVIAEVEKIEGTLEFINPGDLCLAIAPDHKAMADYYLAPIKNLIPLAESKKKPEELLMAQQLGTVIYACKNLPNIIGKTIVVVGQGSAGLWFNFVLKRLGVKKIIGIDRHDHRNKMSKSFGATDFVNNIKNNPIETVKELNNGKLADIVVEAAGTESSINLSIELAESDSGFILQFGVPHEPINVKYSEMFRKCLTKKSIVHAARETGHSSTVEAMKYIADGIVDASILLTHRFSFEDVHKAYELQKNPKDGALKILVEMQK